MEIQLPLPEIVGILEGYLSSDDRKLLFSDLSSFFLRLVTLGAAAAPRLARLENGPAFDWRQAAPELVESDRLQ